MAIVYSAQVNGKVQAGDVQGALDASAKAKMWCWIGFGLGLVINVVVGGLQALAVIGAQSSGRF